MKRLPPNLLAKSRTILQFFSAQGLTMVANLLYGLLCVRLLPASEYAKYVVVFGIMGMLLILMDANLSGTLLPLIGERVNQHKLISDYIASLRRLSTWAYLIVGIVATICFPYLVRNRHWDFKTEAQMIVWILICTWFARMTGAYFPVLMMKGDRATWYKGQLIASFGTLGLLLLCQLVHWLGAFQAIAINVIGYAFVAILCFFRSRQLIGRKGASSPEKQKAIVRLALPNLPQAIFFAVQGQISLFLITYFGHTKGVASVGALGRLGQIFAIFLQGNSLLVEPYFAKLPKHKVKSSYAIALMITVAVTVAVMLVADHMPQMLLWVLGPQYRDLQAEVKLAIGAGAVSCVSGLLWGIHTARRFVYWWNVMFGIVLTLVVQLLFIWKGDIASVRGVLLLTLFTNIASLCVNITAGIYGFVKGPREAESSSIVTEATAEAAAMLDLYPAEEGNIATHSMPRFVQPETGNIES